MALEREAVAREAFEALERVLAAVNLRAGLVRLLADDDLAAETAVVEDLARRGLTSLRRATTTMDALAGRSVPVTRRLRSAVEAYEATHCSAVHLVADDAADTISEAAGRALVRALQEGLSNVERHAEAQTVEVTLTCDPERAEVRLTVTDDGLGVATDATPGTGLELARSELEAVGGRLELQAVPVGARLVAAVPLDA